jgi:hypothetical protein
MVKAQSLGISVS